MFTSALKGSESVAEIRNGWNINPARIAEGIMIALAVAAVFGIYAMRDDVTVIKTQITPIANGITSLDGRVGRLEGRVDENTKAIGRNSERLDCLQGRLAERACPPRDRSPQHE